MKRASRLVAAVVLGIGGIGALAPAAGAHAEAAQDPFLRTQTLAWLETNFSKENIARGEEMVVSGKVRMLTSWPDHTLQGPDIAFLSIVSAGPVFVVRDRRMGGEFVPMTIDLEIGKTYDYRVEIAGRRPGRWHVHPGVAVKHAGLIMGPGKYITVRDGPFANPVRLLNGKIVNTENYGIGNLVLWHFLLTLPGAFLLAWWLIPRDILWRGRVLATGSERGLISEWDKRVTIGLGVFAIVVTVAGSLFAKAAWPQTIPIQYRVNVPPALPEPARFVEGEFNQAGYDQATTTMVIEGRITNIGSSPIVLRSYHTGNATFTRADLPEGERLDLERPTLNFIEGGGAIAPGETRKVVLSVKDQILQEKRLAPEREAQSRLGGVTVWTDAAGNQNYLDIDAEMFAEGGTGGYTG